MDISSSPFVKRQIPELESIRGLAALLVAIFHAPGWYRQKELIPIIANGYLMVDLFFVISGFVIYRAYIDNIQTGSQFWRFQFLRFGRLYPVHLTVLIFILLTTAVPFYETDWLVLMQQLLLIQSIGPWGHPISFNFPAWSISVEFYTYALFGIIALKAKKRSAIIFASLAVVSICLLNPSKEHGLNEVVPGYSELLRCWSGFFLGAIGALLVQRNDWKWHPITTVMSVITLIIFLQFKKNGIFDPLIYPITLALILSICFSSAGVINKILLLPPLKWLGEISYSLYMVQLSVIGIVWETFQHHRFYKLSGLKHLENYLGGSFIEPNTVPLIAICYFVFIAVLLITSWLLHITIENPCRKLSRSLADKITS